MVRGACPKLLYVLLCAGPMMLDLTGTAAANARSLTVSPPSGPPGSKVTVRGTDWSPEYYSTGVEIGFYQNHGNGVYTRYADPIRVPPDSAGRFSFEATIPSSFKAGDIVTFSGIIGNGSGENANFTVTDSGEKTPPASTITVGKAYVANSAWAEATEFKPGDTVRYQIVIAASGDASVNVQMRVVGPQGRAILDSKGDSKVSRTSGSVYFASTIPADATAGTYTQTATVTYDGVVTTRENKFTVDERVDPGGAAGVARILMPFNGRFANGDAGYEDTAPGAHPRYWVGMQWSTDIFAAAGTPVKINVRGTGVSIAVAAVGEIPGCYSDQAKTVKVSAGKYVTLSVSVDGQRVGSIHYQHLDGVNLTTGAAVADGTTLGVTHMWTKSNCWQVNNAAGVHTHLEVGSKSGKACYVARDRGSELGESDTIGALRKGGGYPDLTCPKNL